MKPAPIPESAQGGGTTVTDAEVLEFVEHFQADPASLVAQADDQPQFSKKAGEKKARQARSRTGSAADRMRQKVAASLELEDEEVHAAVRAIEHDGKGAPTRYAYWLTLSAKAQQAVAAANPKTDPAE